MDEKERETKNKFWKGVLAGSLVTAIAVLSAVGLAAGIWIVGHQVTESQAGQAQDQTLEGASDKLDMAKLTAKLAYMEELIGRYFLFDEESEEEGSWADGAEDWIYAGYMYSLQDPYSVYYSAEEYESLTEETNGEYCGIGVQVSQNVTTGIITVIKVFKDSPAREAGMLPGDIIYAVGDMEATGADLSLLVSDHIRGEEGTFVNLTVYRESTDEYVEMDVERRIVENPTVEYAMLEHGIGYISLSAFEEVSLHQFTDAVDDLEGKGLKGLIVDLRNNGGGVLQAAEGIADYLMPDELEIVSFQGKGVEDSSYYTEDGHQLSVPIVVLANGESASASEVLIGALKDNGLATIVGTQTFGKGIAQGIFPMADGSALKLTTSYYYTPSGECIHEIGIAPDVEVELKEELRSLIEIPKEEDNQLQAAIGVLLRGEEAVKAELEAERENAEQESRK